MSRHLSRRRFLKGSLALGPVLGASFEEAALLRQAAKDPSPAAPEKASAAKAGSGLPFGRIKDLRVSRLICGGNLVSGFAHSRDLIYVSTLLKRYFTDEKVFETLEICEENGINTTILRVDEDTLRIIGRYWNERGGKIQWIAQAKPTDTDLTTDVRRAVDTGAQGVYVHGGVGDRWAESGKLDLAAKALDAIKKEGVVSGLAGHSLKTIQAFHEAGLGPDFYMKTLNAKNYWSAGIQPRHDSVWAETPAETVKFMGTVDRPWIAYKILGAGAIHPKDGFRYAFENGADFACVGMFDFQVIEDVVIAKRILSKIERARPWRG